MSKQSNKAKRERNPRTSQNATRRGGLAGDSPKRPADRSLASTGLFVLTAAITITIAEFLRTTWIPFVWLGGVGLWAWYFRRNETENNSPRANSNGFPYIGLFLVVATSILLRLGKINDFPLGPYLDEILVLAHSLELSEKPFDLFGHTPLIRQGWVETPNLYLYFNLLILKLFGVSYVGMKLFSVIPGVVACAVVLVIARVLFAPRAALCLALFFAFAHWPVRLSRYGWDVSFMVMAFSLTVALLLIALERRRGLFAYFSGVVAGIGLYSYAASRICALSVMVFLIIEWLMERERWILRQALAFMTGMIIVAVPLFCYYFSNPHSFWVRAGELSVFNSEAPFLAILENLWRHALMFHVKGGYYSRDNVPGLTMMDPITGLIFLVGVLALCRNGWTRTSRLLSCIFLLNFVPGIFSVSQEGAPYVYRVAAVMLPAFLIVGFGLQRLLTKTTTDAVKPFWRSIPGILSLAALLVTVVLNVYQYFVLESGNAAAMRTMAYEQRLIGNEIARDSAAIFLVGRDILEKIETQSLPAEDYPKKSPPMRLPLSISAFAITAFSGRYDMKRSLEANLKEPKDLYFVEDISPFMGEIVQWGRAKIIFSARDQELAQTLQRHFPAMTLEHLRNLHGDPIVSVATLAKKG